MKFKNSNPKYDNLQAVPSFRTFIHEGQEEFCDFLKKFLQLDDVRIQATNLTNLKKWLEVDEIKNIMRVPNTSDQICLVSQIKTKEGLIAYFPYVIKGYYVNLYYSLKSLLTKVAEAVSDVITLCFLQEFKGGNLMFGDNLGKMIVSNCISSKKHDSIEFAHLIEKMEQLSVTTFEGSTFSTGVIVSENLAKYKNQSLEFKCEKHIDALDKREWLLANGKETFYLLDQNGFSRKIFIKSTPDSTDFINQYFDNYYLKKDLQPSDFIVRTIGLNEISVSDSDHKEFVKIENTWKYRHHKNVSAFLVEKLGIEYRIAYGILYYVLKCSRNHISSIIWIPNDYKSTSITKLTISNRVRVWKKRLNILNEQHEPLLDKVLASDGAVVVQKNGDIIYESVFAKMNKKGTSKGKLTGTGETASSYLSSNGVAIKISQDGLIKIYFDGKKMVY